MREGVILFLLCIIAIGAVAVWMMYVDRTPRGFAPPAAEAAQTPEPAPQPAKKLAVKSVKASAASGTAATAAAAPAESSSASTASEEAHAAAPAEASVAVAAPAPPPPPRPFPSVGEISVGVPEDSIMDAYGDPSLYATTSDRGHVIETFVYARDGIRDVTVISLEDGRVSSAYSKPRATTAIPTPPLRRRGS